MRGLNGVDGLKYGARRFAARLLFVSGAIDAYRRRALRNRLIVLMYHRVIPRVEWDASPSSEGMRVDSTVFEKQMAYLTEHFRCIAIEDLRRFVRNRNPFPTNSCLVTFDDGWKDNYIHAYPVLKRYSIPAVIFLSVGHIGTRKRFWQERIFAALYGIREAARRDPGSPARYRHIPGGMNVEEISGLPEGKFRERVREQIRSLKKLPLNLIEPTVDELAACAGTRLDEEGDPFLSWEEVMTMSRGGVDFGSHGMSHEILTNISVEEVSKDVRISKAIIEDKIQKSVYAFSYPNGDHDLAVRKCIVESGYEIAFGTNKGFAGPDDDPLSLKRVNVHDDVTREVPMFLSSILGIF